MDSNEIEFLEKLKMYLHLNVYQNDTEQSSIVGKVSRVFFSMYQKSPSNPHKKILVSTFFFLSVLLDL